MPNEPTKEERITGTRDDNTLNIVGEGAAELGHTQVAGDEELRRVTAAGQTKPGQALQDPCKQYGHHEKYYRASDGVEYPVTPRVCRHCNAAY